MFSSEQLYKKKFLNNPILTQITPTTVCTFSPQVSATDPDSGDFGLVRYPRLLGDDPVLRGVTKVIMAHGEHFRL